MQSYRTCHASQITGIRVGRSIVTAAVKPVPGQTESNERAQIDHEQRLAAIRSNTNLADEDRQKAIEAETDNWNHQQMGFNPPDGPIDKTIKDPVTGKTRTKSLDEIKSEQLARDKLSEPDESDANSDGVPDETQDIIHLVLTGGEKRSILRSDLSFAQSVIDRGQTNVFPGYAQRGPMPDRHGLTDQNSLNSTNTTNPPQAPVPETDQIYPLVGDWLVEDWDVFSDKYIQKIYDNATFGRYFKASLN